MTNGNGRTFEDRAAIRERVPLVIGLMGPSGSGKTFSALRLATGMQRVIGGDIFVIDTEARRALHYADQFEFRHIEHVAPFGSLDYLAAIEHCVSRGAGTVIIDSLSHEHEGPGGLLETHETECDRLMRAWNASREKVQLAAWQKPKQERRRLINTILQVSCNIIACFRAKEKIKPRSGGGLEDLGWMPIAGEEFLYETTLCVLLEPGARGVPTWSAQRRGEQAIVKLPRQFAALFATPEALSEDHGFAMARWASGEGSAPTAEDLDRVMLEIEQAASRARLDRIASEQRRRAWSAEQRVVIRGALSERKNALKELDSTTQHEETQK